MMVRLVAAKAVLDRALKGAELLDIAERLDIWKRKWEAAREQDQAGKAGVPSGGNRAGAAVRVGGGVRSDGGRGAGGGVGTGGFVISPLLLRIGKRHGPGGRCRNQGGLDGVGPALLAGFDRAVELVQELLSLPPAEQQRIRCPRDGPDEYAVGDDDDQGGIPPERPVREIGAATAGQGRERETGAAAPHDKPGRRSIGLRRPGQHSAAVGRGWGLPLGLLASPWPSAMRCGWPGGGSRSPGGGPVYGNGGQPGRMFSFLPRRPGSGKISARPIDIICRKV